MTPTPRKYCSVKTVVIFVVDLQHLSGLIVFSKINYCFGGHHFRGSLFRTYLRGLELM